MGDIRLLIEQAYTAFNKRDIDGALALMTRDVSWPKASEGGKVVGKEEIRAYWTRQWGEFDPHVEPLAITEGDAGKVRVRVRQLVKSVGGDILSDSEVVHVFTVSAGLIAAMDLGDEADPSAGPSAAFAHRPPNVDCEQNVPTLPVSDVRDAASFYTKKLGFSLGFTWGDPPEFGGVNLGRATVHLARGTPNPTGVEVSFFVSDADALYEFQRANGVEILEAPEDRPWGLREYRVRDGYGYVLRFGHPIYNVGPGIPIERVDVPVRLEKRLAAVLRDLAEHKRMSVSSCLEETLLHTFEPLGDGVASPHTQAQLRYIQELKRKHGIDYDSHGSYRFIERP